MTRLSRVGIGFCLMIVCGGLISCSEGGFVGKRRSDASPTPTEKAGADANGQPVTPFPRASIPTGQAPTQGANVTAVPGKGPQLVNGQMVNPDLGYGSCPAPCAGRNVLIFNSKYGKWVKLVLCSETRYDIFMGEKETGPFSKVGDTAGHGQDHCELVNPTFFTTMSSGDDIKSGGCTTCKEAHAGSISNIPALWGTQMYWRSQSGEAFQSGTGLRASIHTSCWYECGVSF